MKQLRVLLPILLLVFSASAEAAGHCIDSFASRTVLSAEELWLEKPFKPGTQYEPKSRGLSEDLFKEIVEITDSLIKQCGEGCLMVGVGRSPTVLIAQAQVMQQDAINLPLSTFRSLPGFNKDSKKPNFPSPYDRHQDNPAFYELNTTDEKILFDHFEAFIGSRLRGTRKILLVDFSQSGASLFATQAYLNKWLSSRKEAASPEVHSVNIGERTYDQISERMRQIWNVDSSRISKHIGSTLMFELNYARFDKWAEYTSYKVGGRYSENHHEGSDDTNHPYLRLRNTLAVMNLARTNNPKLIPHGTKLPTAVYWDLETKIPRNRKTGTPVDLGLEH